MSAWDELPAALEEQRQGVTVVLSALYQDLWTRLHEERDATTLLAAIEAQARVGIFLAADLASRAQLQDLRPGVRHPQVLLDTASRLAEVRASVVRERAAEVLRRATENMVSPYARLAASVLVTDAARAGGKAAGIVGDATHKRFIRLRPVQEPRAHSKYENTVRPVDGTWLIAGIEVDGPGDERLPWSERAWCGHGLRYFRR